ncbi:MAG: replication initiation protein [Dermatophilus congolensis]|nr:replication initiation protein [Dermatophilus congolensis]
MSVLVGHSDAPSLLGGTFPGYAEGAPLELPSTLPASSLVARLLDGTHEAFADTLAGVHNCTHPIRLRGTSTTIDAATGEVVSSFTSADMPLGELYVPCGNRRASVCPACSRTYARDTFELIRSGVVGGKTVPTTVAACPLLFVTLTAPSFGLVHGLRPNHGVCRPRSSDRVSTCPHGVRLSCSARHGEDDPAVGAPLCWDCCDWTSAVVWQFHAPELWRRTTTGIRRALAARIGVSESKLRERCTVQFAKVAEYQARGAIHFHALIRLDGPDGPGTPCPFDAEDLAGAVAAAARAVTVTAPPAFETDSPRVLAWGAQLDVKTITHGAGDLATSDELTPEQVAGYLAKYATKDATDLRQVGDRPHLVRLTAECRELYRHAHERSIVRALDGDHATVVPLDPKTGLDHYALIGKWAHMLGFRGHFSTKSRRFSITLGKLRAARARFRRLVEHSHRTGVPLDTRDLEARLLADDDTDETTLIVGSWEYAGTGWPKPGDAELANAAAARAREYDQWRAEHRR